MLKVRNLSKSFSNSSILKDVNFTLDQGKICAVVGSNGSGKTTFLKCLSGLMSYDEGVVDFGSKNGQLFLSDKLNILGDLTIKQNLEVLSRYYNQDFNQASFKESLKLLNINQYKELPLKFLSRGNLQRNKLCVAINLNWDYLLIDEPFSNLDYDGVKIFKDIFENFKSENKSIIFSTHQNDDNSFCDKIVIVEDFKET